MYPKRLLPAILGSDRLRPLERHVRVVIVATLVVGLLALGSPVGSDFICFQF